MMPTLQWRILLGVVLVFLAGAATGFFGGAWHAHRTFGERHGRMMGERMRERMERRLDLTPEQMKVVDPILRKTGQRLDEIRRETGQRVWQAMEDSRRDLATHLTPEQMDKLEQMKKRHERRRERRAERRRRPPPADDAP